MFIVKYEQMSHIALVFPLLNLDKLIPTGQYHLVDTQPELYRLLWAIRFLCSFKAVPPLSSVM